MARTKKIVKKKSAPKRKSASKKNKITSRGMAKPATNSTDPVAPEALVTLPAVNIPQDQLIIELCAPNKRCKQRTDGSFIRQNFISGRWQQVGGTTFPSLAACKKACTG
jgi:hypothetical protein